MTGMVRGRPVTMLALLIGIAALGCDQDPARSIKIIDRSPAAAAPAATSPPPAGAPASPAAAPATPAPPVAPALARRARPSAQWRPDACPPPADAASGPSDLSVTGPCAFEHRSAAICESLADDFLVAVSRKAANGATLVVYINVEQYHGPGDYDESQMFVAVQDGKSMYRWSNERGKITVGAGEKFVDLPKTLLDAEPMLVDCKRVIGAETNFQYDCGGRTDERTPLESTIEIASGRLSCAETK